jgi:hypothetical protein
LIAKPANLVGFAIFVLYIKQEMGKILHIFLVLFCFSESIAKANFSTFFIENDTLNKSNFDSSSYVIYPSLGGGFASGNNAYLDKVKAQEFRAGNLCNIHGILLYFGKKRFASLSDSSYVGINFYHLNGTGRNTVSASAACPGNIFHHDSIKVADIDTINGNVLTYNNPLYTDSNFAIGIDFDQLNAADTIALYTNKNGDAGSREQSWEQDAAGNWFTLKYNWPLNVDFAIFPIVNTSVGLDLIRTNKPSLILSPNPTYNGQVNIHISTSLVKTINVYNSNMQLVPSESFAKDEANLTIQIGTPSKGIYFIEVQSKNNIQIEKLIVE